MIRCHRTRRRTFHVPAKAMVTCVDKPRTMLGNCGDLADAENPKLVNQINQETVKIECYSDFCRLKCRSSLMGFRYETSIKLNFNLGSVRVQSIGTRVSSSAIRALFRQLVALMLTAHQVTFNSDGSLAC